MSNMKDINKKIESALLPLELCARLKKASEEKGISKSDIIQLALSHELRDVILLPNDYRWIAEQVEKNIASRKMKGV